MIKFTAISCTQTSRELGEYPTVGIAVLEGARQIACIADIAPDQREVEQLAELMNREQASLEHFSDIIEDYVAAR